MKERFDRLNKWFQTERGLRVIRRVLPQLATILPNIYGDHSLQIGIEEQKHWLDACHIRHKHVVAPYDCVSEHVFQAKLHELPLTEKSIDFVFAPFSLEMLTLPQPFLCEVERVTRDGAYVLFFGINPVSSWGLPGYLRKKEHFGLGRVNLFSAGKLRRHLDNLGFKTVFIHRFFYAPPWVKKRFVDNLFEHLGHMILPVPPGFYLLLAKKTDTLAIRPTWSYENYQVDKNTIISS